MKLTKSQSKTLYAKFRQAKSFDSPFEGSFLDFRRLVEETFKMDDAVVFPLGKIWCLIETDGYCHS
tara:strand:+ start:179 stop:376 length:198 start_codon:yes stop_codon:yes gene_type:complete